MERLPRRCDLLEGSEAQSSCKSGLVSYQHAKANTCSQKKQPKTDEELYAEWVEKYGEEAAGTIKQTVNDNVGTYEYLKQYAIKL